MASILQVEQIKGPTSGAGANTITIPSGQTLDVNGTLSGDGSNLTGISNTPAFRVSLSSSLTLSNATWTNPTFNSVQLDTDSAYNTSNGRFTVPTGQGGKYFFYGKYRLQTGGSAYLAIELHKNGSRASYFGGGDLSTYPSCAISEIIELNAGDYVELNAYQDTGASTDITNDPHYTNFGGFKIL